MNKIYLLASLFLMIGLANANIVPIFQYNPGTNTITILIPPQAGKSLNYGQNATYSFNDLIISNVTFGFVSNTVTYNTSGKTSQIVITAPQNNQPLHQSLACVNGEKNQSINNVSISCPKPINANMILVASSLNVSNTINPAPNITVTGKVNAVKPCSQNEIINGSYTQIQIIQNQTWPCNLNLTVLQNKKIGIFENITAPGNFINQTLGIGIYAKLPNRGLRIQIPFGESYAIPGENSIISTQNITNELLNFTNLNNAYNKRFLNKTTCASNITLGGIQYCIAIRNQSNFSAATVCDKLALINHNVFLGLGNCIYNITQRANAKNDYNFSQSKFYQKNASDWHDKYEARVTSDTNGSNAQSTVLWLLAAIFAGLVILGSAFLILRKKARTDEERQGREYETRLKSKKASREKEEDR